MNTATTTETVYDLCDYETSDALRKATVGELRASLLAARTDGGAAVIDVDGQRCYVESGEIAIEIAPDEVLDDQLGLREADEFDRPTARDAYREAVTKYLERQGYCVSRPRGQRILASAWRGARGLSIGGRLLSSDSYGDRELLFNADDAGLRASRVSLAAIPPRPDADRAEEIIAATQAHARAVAEHNDPSAQCAECKHAVPADDLCAGGLCPDCAADFAERLERARYN